MTKSFFFKSKTNKVIYYDSFSVIRIKTFRISKKYMFLFFIYQKNINDFDLFANVLLNSKIEMFV